MISNLLKIGVVALIGTAGLLSTSDASAQMYHFGKFNSKYKTSPNKKQNSKFITSLQLGYNYTLPYDVSFTTFFSGTDMEGRYLMGNLYTTKVAAEPLLSVNMGIHIPIYNFNEKMSLAITIGVEANMMKANTGNMYVTPFQSFSADFTQSTFSLPIGMAYKYGSDASFVKSDRFSGSFGIAAAPGYVMTEFGNYFSEATFTVTPFVFAELGAMGGLNWKIRGTCMPFGITGFKKNPGEPGMEAFPNSSSISAKSGPIFQVGIAIQPLALMWDKRHW